MSDLPDGGAEADADVTRTRHQRGAVDPADGRAQPVGAEGTVHVPGSVRIALSVDAYVRTEPTGEGSWSLPAPADSTPMALAFLRALPPGSIDTLSLRSVDTGSFGYVGES